MKRYTSSFSLFNLFKAALRHAWKNKDQLFYFSAVPLFFIFVSYLVSSYLPQSFLTTALIYFFKIVNEVLVVVFSVQWIRLLLKQERVKQVFIPIFRPRYLNYGILMLGLVFIVSLGMSFLMTVVGPGNIIFFGFLFKGIFLFLFSRFSYAFISAALDRPYQVQKTWEKSQNYGAKLFGYLFLVELIGGLISALLVVVFAFTTLERLKDTQGLLVFFIKNSWALEIFMYGVLAIKLYGVSSFVRKEL